MKMQTDNRTVDDFIDDLSRILNLEGLHTHTRRAVLYKSIEDYTQILKRQGKARWSTTACNFRDQGKSRKDFVLEHPVPKSVITERIAPLDGLCPRGEQLRNDLCRAFKDLMHVCWVHRTEDSRLRTAGLKSRLPIHSASWDSIDRWSRYKDKAVNIEIDGGYV